MSVAQQAIRRRRSAKFDERYKYRARDSDASARRLAAQIRRENEIRQRKGNKKK